MKIYKISQVQNAPNPQALQEVNEATANLQLGLVAIKDHIQRLEISGLKDEIIKILNGNAAELISSGNSNKFSGANLQEAINNVSQILASMSSIDQSIQVIKTTMPDKIQDITRIIQTTTPDKFTQQMTQYFTNLGPAMNVNM